MNLAEPRTKYAVDVLGDMFPGASVGPGNRSSGPDDRTFALAPSGGRPRLLVPAKPRDAAAAALRAYGGRLTRGARLSYGAAARAVAIAGPAILRARFVVAGATEGIDTFLSEALGRDVTVAVHLTPSRANRKPVIQALAHGERYPIGFAKLAVNPLTEMLVDREAQALEALADRHPHHLVTPQLAHIGRFAGHTVMTQRPLPTWLPGRSPTLPDVTTATREVAALSPPHQIALSASDYWRDVQQRAQALEPSPAAQRLAQCVDRLTVTLGDIALTFTASHGDWSPWNMWLTDRGLLVWDWERFERQTPAGFDLLHFRLNDQFIRGGRTSEGVGQRLVADAPDVLETGEIDAPALHTVLLYLVHLGLRYESDGQAAAGSRLGQLESWLLPAIEAGLADPALRKRN